jgi:hypothetical protein
MMVNVPVPLTPEEQSALLAQARAQGLTLDTLLRKAVLQSISPGPEIKLQAQQQLCPEDFDRAFEEIADMLPEGIPAVLDEALSRESIYTREDEWNRR